MAPDEDGFLDLDEILAHMATRREAVVQAEELSTQKLDLARRLTEGNRQVFQGLAAGFGLTDGLMRMIAADTRQLGAAEADFQAAVEIREALDAVVREIEAWRDREEGEG